MSISNVRIGDYFIDHNAKIPVLKDPKAFFTKNGYVLFNHILNCEGCPYLESEKFMPEDGKNNLDELFVVRCRLEKSYFPYGLDCEKFIPREDEWYSIKRLYKAEVISNRTGCSQTVYTINRTVDGAADSFTYLIPWLTVGEIIECVSEEAAQILKTRCEHIVLNGFVIVNRLPVGLQPTEEEYISAHNICVKVLKL